MRHFAYFLAALLAIFVASGCWRSELSQSATARTATDSDKPTIAVAEDAPVESDAVRDVGDAAPTAASSEPEVTADDAGIPDETETADAQSSDHALALDTLRNQLEGDDPATRRDAALAIGDLHEGGQAAAGDLAGALRDTDHEVRAAAAEALGKIGLRDPAITAEFLELIDRAEHPQVLRAALTTLGALGLRPDADPAPLIRGLASEDELVRREAAWLLGELAPHETALDDVTAALIGALSDDFARVRESAYGSLGQLGKGRPQITLALLPLLESSDADLRYRAAYALSLIGPDARMAIPTLLDLIQREQDEETRAEAIRALREIDPQAAKGMRTPPNPF